MEDLLGLRNAQTAEGRKRTVPLARVERQSDLKYVPFGLGQFVVVEVSGRRVFAAVTEANRQPRLKRGG